MPCHQRLDRLGVLRIPQIRRHAARGLSRQFRLWVRRSLDLLCQLIAGHLCGSSGAGAISTPTITAYSAVLPAFGTPHRATEFGCPSGSLTQFCGTLRLTPNGSNSPGTICVCDGFGAVAGPAPATIIEAINSSPRTIAFIVFKY